MVPQSASSNSEMSWRDIQNTSDLQEALTNCRQASTNNSLSSEERNAIQKLCFVTNEMYPQIVQRIEQQTGSGQSKAAATAGQGQSGSTAGKQDNSGQSRAG